MNMFTRIKRLIKLTMGVAAVAWIGASSLNATELVGAGASFPFPLYSKMFSEYVKETGVKVNYQAIGSGGGIRQLENKTVDFGASDGFLSDKKLASMKQPILHVPMALGGVSLSYNIPGVSVLKLTPEVLANIYLGKIKKWNDPSIQSINPDVKLPKMKIVVTYRSDGSGTTLVFSDYLSKISDIWKKKVGSGKSLKWPTGIGGKGNAGVAGYIKQIPGAIGYIEVVYALQNKLKVAFLKNQSGYFVQPNIKTISQAAKVTVPDDTRVFITNTEATYGYPISGFTWILVFQDQNYSNRSKEQAQATKELLMWMCEKGQSFAADLNYAPLPESMMKKGKDIINTLTYAGEPL